MTDTKQALNRVIDAAFRISLAPVAVKAVEAARQCLEQPSAESRDNAGRALVEVLYSLPTGRVRLRVHQALLLAKRYCDEHLQSIEEQQ